MLTGREKLGSDSQLYLINETYGEYKIMKFKSLIIVLLLIFSMKGMYAQVTYDKNGNPNLKGLSEEDTKRILGDIYAPKFFKTLGETRQIKESIINGNKITSIIFNYGSICAPNRLSQIADLVWNGLGYGFEFGPLAAAEVLGKNGEQLQICDDSFILPTQGDYSPDNTLKWGWLPKAGYVDTTQGEIARLNAEDTNGDGKPDSWPELWYNAGAGKYIWPAFLGDQATAPDEEVFFVVDDYTNREFPYYPFDNDSTKRGLGLDMQVRIIQFNNALAEDIMFLVYSITNASDKFIPKAYFGMHGDPHIGGSADYGDDRAGFVDASGFSLQSAVNFPQRARNMVYAWDPDQTGAGGKKTGYFGWKFLESPSIANDAIDNDYDGYTDETPDNSCGTYLDGNAIFQGITDLTQYTAVFGAPKARWSGDEDGDWNIDRDDIGIDGIGPDSPNYPGADYGEGDGKPSQGWYLDDNNNGKYDAGETITDERTTGYKWAGSEPNFGLRDISESDQIGLTAFHAALYTNSDPNVPRNDPLMWEWLSTAGVDTAGQNLLLQAGDNVFNFGTGPLSLAQGETQRFSMCILFGNDLQDLILNSSTSTKILEADYRFAQPPIKPVVTAVPGDGKVRLYWDTRAEDSVDPLTGKKDFLGYKVYRSRDYTFSDIYTITDARGNPTLAPAYTNQNTGEMAQWHIPLDPAIYVNGFHPVELSGIGVKYYVGDPADNSGLRHEYVDSSVVNGVTYYYAVVAYDNGSIDVGNELPPTENKAIIRKDAITGELKYDVNTVVVTPGPLANGMIDADAGVGGNPDPAAGVVSTGKVFVKVLNSFEVPDSKTYSIDFSSPTEYSVTDSTGIDITFTANDTVYVGLGKTNIKPESIVVKDASGNVVDASKYYVNTVAGRIKGTSGNSLPAGQKYSIYFRYQPVYKSTLVKYEDSNPSFDGMRLFVQTNTLDLNYDGSSFSSSTNTNLVDSLLYNATGNYPGNPKVQYRADWEVRWNNLDTLAGAIWQNIGDTVKSAANKDIKCPFTIYTLTGTGYKKANYIINENIDATKNNGQWDWGEGIILRPQVEDIPSNKPSTVSYFLTFKLPKNEAPVLPKQGDIYTVKTTKPFLTGDKYVFTTKSAKFDKQTSNPDLSKIYCVPNPYVAYSLFEEPGRTSSKRGERAVQFRNLPSKCTIRIYTIAGDLVKTIEKDDLASIATWDLLSSEGQKISYGVYVYHVDAPGIGEHIGRLAVIK